MYHLSMKNGIRKIHQLICESLIVSLAVLYMRCGDPLPLNNNQSDPETFRYLKIQYLSGTLIYNFALGIPEAKRLQSEVTLILTNTSTIKNFSGLKIPFSDVHDNTSVQSYGKIFYTTDWDGAIPPLKSDTVRLVKSDSLTQYVEPACGHNVYFLTKLVADQYNSKNIISDSLVFQCVN